MMIATGESNLIDLLPASKRKQLHIIADKWWTNDENAKSPYRCYSIMLEKRIPSKGIWRSRIDFDAAWIALMTADQVKRAIIYQCGRHLRCIYLSLPKEE
jgi:hypothetical protein